MLDLHCVGLSQSMHFIVGDGIVKESFFARKEIFLTQNKKVANSSAGCCPSSLFPSVSSYYVFELFVFRSPVAFSLRFKVRKVTRFSSLLELVKTDLLEADAWKRSASEMFSMYFVLVFETINLCTVL